MGGEMGGREGKAEEEERRSKTRREYETNEKSMLPALGAREGPRKLQVLQQHYQLDKRKGRAVGGKEEEKEQGREEEQQE
eukprot:758239-Hanusia_phi.AAC.1